ncbi:hypothetical protein SAMN06272783_0040 [Serratia sp. JKS296]|nr:hypothetical protein SAMN06272783_0040 [Serratia sp. JKS296]
MLNSVFSLVDSVSTPCPELDYETNQALGFIPKRSSSFRPKVLSQLAKLIPAAEAAASNCAFSSGAIRTWKAGALPPPLGCLSLCIIVDMYVPIWLTSIEIGTHLNTVTSTKTTPRSAGTLPGRLTNNVMETNAMAKPQCNQTHPKFQYRFLAINRAEHQAKPRQLSIEATSEQEARQILAPHFILSFAARLPLLGVCHA